MNVAQCWLDAKVVRRILGCAKPNSRLVPGKIGSVVVFNEYSRLRLVCKLWDDIVRNWQLFNIIQLLTHQRKNEEYVLARHQLSGYHNLDDLFEAFMYKKISYTIDLFEFLVSKDHLFTVSVNNKNHCLRLQRIAKTFNLEVQLKQTKTAASECRITCPYCKAPGLSIIQEDDNVWSLLCLNCYNNRFDFSQSSPPKVREKLLRRGHYVNTDMQLSLTFTKK